MYNPIATYRIQFNKDFTLGDFERIIPYLHQLGVRTLYASPIFEAVPGSVHGYDSVNPHRINPEIGTESQLRAISQQLTQRDIGWLQDIVPNHMAYHPSNAWLMDVLEKGQRSRYAAFFDILWTSPGHSGRLMVPFLGASLAEVIDKGELAVAWQPQQLVLRYYESNYPLRLSSYATVLRAATGETDEALQPLIERLADIESITAPTAYALRVTAWQTELATWLQTEAGGTWLKGCLSAINTNAVLLQQLADEQVYELCLHSETDHRINFRRFFTINGLICLNIQDEAVFGHFHERIRDWLAEGVFQGVRVDHVDGLYDPARYLAQLRQLAGPDAYIVIEKILQQYEALPSNWPIQGGTGYSYLSLVNNLFTHNPSEAVFTRFYHKLLGEKMSIRTELRDKKKFILDEYMRGELENLYQLFLSLNLTAADTLAALPRESLKAAIGTFLIDCSVYRYYGNQMPLEEDEREAVRDIFARVRRSEPQLVPAANVLEACLLANTREGNIDYNKRALQFYQRCMQFTGPLMAKGVEDTLMYTYNRFIGHDEVGDSPEFFGITVDRFHQNMLERQKHWPLALSATATHDTKRGEGVRSRLNVLTDLADEWVAEVEAWQQLNRSTVPLPADAAPDANDEYLIYQVLTGAYPMPGQGEDDFPNRLAEYLQKALREAKRYSSWSKPDEDYEAATQQFSAMLLDQSRPFWTRFQQFHRKIADFGIVNSLAQLVLKCTCPGLPDVYQGCELWDLSLVDPDNRRPVDFARRQQWLDELVAANTEAAEQWQSLWQDRYDARIKLWLVHTLLSERTRQPDLFAEGEYIPLHVEGEHRDHVFAFARRHHSNWCVVAVPLGLARLCRAQQTDITTVDWADTRIALPDDAPNRWYHRLLNTTGQMRDSILVGDIFIGIPLALLELQQPGEADPA